MSDFCNDLKVIPQFVGSCWFNAFLMVMLYSQNARKAMIKASKKWDKKDKFLNILKIILKKNYNDPSIATYYNKIQPQLILFKFLKKYNPEMEKFMKEKLKNDGSFGWNQNYIADFLHFINPKTINLAYFDKTNDIFINFLDNFKFSYDKSLKIKFKMPDITEEDYIKQNKKKLSDIPDFICLYHTKLNNIFNFSQNVAFKTDVFHKRHNLSYNYKDVKINKDDIKNFKDEFFMNGIKYRLDSCILADFNAKFSRHSIAGITCNNKKYVYNGWIKRTLDPAMRNQLEGINEFPCSLMRHDWNIKKDKDFCLNSQTCKLDFVNKNDLCFNFSKGNNRILIYVRVYDEKTSEISSINTSKADLSNIEDLLKDIYQINKLKIGEVKKHLKDFNYTDFNNKSVKDLQQILLDILTKNIDLKKKDVKKKDVKKKDVIDMKSKKLEDKLLYIIKSLIKNAKANTIKLRVPKKLAISIKELGTKFKEFMPDLYEDFKMIESNIDYIWFQIGDYRFVIVSFKEDNNIIYNISFDILPLEKDNKFLVSRKDIYKKFKSFKDYKGKLLKQQVFLADYITKEYSSIDKMLLFHGIGTGKTCTSITIAESIMNKDKDMKALVILPARLKTNFIDELISENCGMNRYISSEDFKKYIDFKTSKKDKDGIRKKFMEKISEKYQILSYESLRISLLKSTNIKETIDRITNNRIIIIDEVHNLITTRINSYVIENILIENKISKNTKMINGIIMRLMTLLANKSSKFFLLTATPVFDNYGQFIEMVLNLCPDIKETDLNRNVDDLSFLVEKLRGKVSFYKLKDTNAYPKTIVDNIEIPLSKTQDKMIVGEKPTENENSPLFCITERQISISAYSLKKKDEVFANLKEYAPKLKKLFDLLKLDGKHVVYSNFIQYCLYLIAVYLKNNGWNNFIEDGIKNYKTFVIWDASLDDVNKQSVKNVLNSVSNMDGKDIRLVLGSPSIKEGISFLHIQHLHQIDPVWNSSAKTQVEGRCIRYKSHDDIPLNHPKLKREVVIHNYISVPRKNGLVETTCDTKIYYEIIKKKAKIISIIEGLLKKVSIDYYLWTEDNSPSSNSSRISLSREKEELDELIKKKKKRERETEERDKKIKNTCPVKRRPTGEGNCPPDFPFMRKNPKGFECCYKKKK